MGRTKDLRSFACGLALVVAACGGDSGSSPDAGEPIGDMHQYVTNQLNLPPSSGDAEDYGLDLDNDQISDNVFGGFLGFVIDVIGFDLQIAVSEAITEGSLVLLHEVQAEDLENTGNAGWQVFIGQELENPIFDGTGSFTKSGRQSDQLAGTIVSGNFNGGPATVSVSLPLTGAIVDLTLLNARIEASVSEQGCDGVLAGAITETARDEDIFPAIADLANAAIASDPGCQMDPPMCGAGTSALLGFFDDDGDLVITDEEVLDSAISSLLEPDLDSLDANGDPGQDGVFDSISFGVRFTCVGATF